MHIAINRRERITKEVVLCMSNLGGELFGRIDRDDEWFKGLTAKELAFYQLIVRQETMTSMAEAMTETELEKTMTRFVRSINCLSIQNVLKNTGKRSLVLESKQITAFVRTHVPRFLYVEEFDKHNLIAFRPIPRMETERNR